MTNYPKRNWKKALGLMLIALSLASCGGKKNTTSSNNSNVNNPSNPTNTNLPYTSTALSKAKAEIACVQYTDQYGSVRTGRRVNKDFSFQYQTGNASLTSIAINAQMPQGHISGQTAMEFVGVGTFGDIMVVTKIVNGSTLMGYNVAISLCEMTSQYNNQSYINDSIQATQLYGINNGISLSVGTHCNYGKVTAASVMIQLSSLSQAVPFSFYAPGCQSNAYQH
jgi:hypothetical protein